MISKSYGRRKGRRQEGLKMVKNNSKNMKMKIKDMAMNARMTRMRRS